jgi:uncharacterized protein (DUF1697 family)
MPRFVAFLRGINVGGHIVKKDSLDEIFISLNFLNVSVYKQSGNVMFETDVTDAEEIQSKVEAKLQAILGYNVAVFVRTFSQLKCMISQDPFKGKLINGSSLLVTLFHKPVTFIEHLPLIIPKSTAKIFLVCGTEVFSVTHGGGEGALPNSFLESKLKVKATTRNINILREIVEKYNDDAV